MRISRFGGGGHCDVDVKCKSVLMDAYGNTDRDENGSALKDNQFA